MPRYYAEVKNSSDAKGQLQICDSHEGGEDRYVAEVYDIQIGHKICNFLNWSHEKQKESTQCEQPLQQSA